MTLAKLAEKPTQQKPTVKWTVAGFGRFWKNPKPEDVEAIRQAIWPDIKGYWPRGQAPLVGADNYIKGCAEIIRAIPDFSLQVCDSAVSENIAFVRWEVSGRFSIGPQIMTGVDRLLLRDGFVIENRIHSDHPIFEQLAKGRLLG